MKKIYLPLFLISVLLFPNFVMAANQSGSQNNQGTANSNQNAVQTQNQGEDTMVQVKEEEQEMEGEDTGTGGGMKYGNGGAADESKPNEGEDETGKYGLNRNENVYQNMSVVAQKVQELKTLGDTNDQFGQQIKIIAQNQNETQTRIQSQLAKVDSRKGLLKVIIGPDFAAVKNMRKELEQNQAQIMEMEQIMYQLQNQGDAVQIQSAVIALREQQLMFEEKLNQEEGTISMLGWLFRMLVK